MKSPIKVAVTGAAGQIGYSLLFRIASGAMFGPDQPVELHLIEVPQALGALEGVLVVGNPCNTNCLIAMNNAKGVPADRWFAMTRLDENRAKSQLAKRAGVPVAEVTNLAVWGNHSPTMYPDFHNARITSRPATEVLPNQPWLEHEFLKTVQPRGSAI